MDIHNLKYIFTPLFEKKTIFKIKIHNLKLFIFTWFQLIFHQNIYSEFNKLILILNI